MNQDSVAYHELALSLYLALNKRVRIDANKKVGVAPQSPPLPEDRNPTVYVQEPEILARTGRASMSRADYEQLKKHIDDIEQIKATIIPCAGSDNVAGLKVERVSLVRLGPTFASLKDLEDANSAEVQDRPELGEIIRNGS